MSASLKARILRQIELTGPISVADYMAQALYDAEYGYYATRPGIGEDFITAPETSQMFGELIGLWCAHEWRALGAPAPFHWIELGPGSGALMRDALRAVTRAADFRRAAHLHFVEASMPLRAQQAAALAPADACWHANLDAITPAPALIIANEFLDCLPIRQFVRTQEGWRERLVGVREGALCFGLAPEALRRAPFLDADAPLGAVCEIAPGLPALIEAIARRLAPGRALIIDYGAPGAGDTLQALAEHRKVDPLAAPGAADLTAHVDFTAVTRLAREAGLETHGPMPQGAFLRALGLDQRTAALARAAPEDAGAFVRQHARLTGDDQMGVLFQVLCLSSPGLPTPAGF